ncbi:B2 bradykinin receptor [Salarias fasciatus]|uniref:B2 bradykinin receptor n=1 Tax=Salarias fasciatus TaxID=181472 RepID=A0A672HC87_SALFA|nr:B2 bradykinin receptor-like [Salarias fasciatus]
MTFQPTSVPDFSTPAFHEAQNQTNGSHCPDPEAWEWLNAGQPVYIMLIAILGIAFNLFVLMVFLLHKKPCTVAEIYLSNLAAADLILVSCLPFWAINIASDFVWPFGNFMCKAVSVGIKMNAYSSIYLLVLVSIDRYVALVHTMSYGRMRRPKYAKLGCLLTWGFGLLMSIPTFIFRGVKYLPDYDISACLLLYPSETVAVVYEVMLTIFSFIIPISVISFCTIKIIQALQKQGIERCNVEKTEHKATTLVLVVLLAFLICWVPFHLVSIWDWLLRAEVMGGCLIESAIDICNQITSYLAFFNSVLNPILYVIVGKNFRKKVCELFNQWKTKKVTSDSGQSNLSNSSKLQHDTLMPNS